MNAIGIAIDVLVAVLVVLGTVIILISSLGVIRLPDVYTRAHATTKASTLGLLSILIGTFIHFMYHHQLVSVRLLLGIIFVFLTAPVAGHMIIRSAHRSGVPLSDISAQDALREDFGTDDGASGESVRPEETKTAVRPQQKGSPGNSPV